MRGGKKMALSFNDLSLDELVAHLISGGAVKLHDGTDLVFGDDSRAVLAHYNTMRDTYWNPAKSPNIMDREIDQLLSALDKKVAAQSTSPKTAPVRKRWILTRIEAHRFSGLHRHCAAGGNDPPLFDHTFTSDLSLFHGFNGAGKTSLLNAICWCLTGHGYRPQSLPRELHEPLDVDVMKAVTKADGTAESIRDSTFTTPLLVPVPSDQELELLGGKPKTDTWVRLTFTSLDDGTVQTVKRELVTKKKVESSCNGLDKLGLSDLPIRVGTLLPGIAAAMRLDDETDLTAAVAILTGLRPLAHFGHRAGNLHDRLSGKFTEKAEEDRDSALREATQQKAILTETLKDYKSFPDLNCIKLPDEQEPEQWRNGIAQAKLVLQSAEETAKADAELILGGLPSLTTDNDIDRFTGEIDQFAGLLRPSSLRGLPSYATWLDLGKVTDEELASAKAKITNIEASAQAIAVQIADAARFNRKRLYALVAKWHQEQHPDKPIDSCPVCDADLKDGSVPHDAMLDKSVAEALEQARIADSEMALSAAEWERARVQELLQGLPESLKQFSTTPLPNSAAELFGRAFAGELFEEPEMPPRFKRISPSAKVIWDKAAAELPTMPVSTLGSLPSEIPDKSDLRAILTRVERAIRFCEYRKANSEAIKAALTRILTDRTVDDLPANRRSLAMQIDVLRTYTLSARAYANVKRIITLYEAACTRWLSQINRLKALARAAKAVAPLAALKVHVQTQVASLILTLNVRAQFWANAIYKAQFPGAPEYVGLDPDCEDSFRLLAEKGLHRFDAGKIMNASALRTYLWAFVLALWEYVWKGSGGLSCILMDDPQDLLDPANTNNLAASIPRMLENDMRPIIVANDQVFLRAVLAHKNKYGPPVAQMTARMLEFSAVSGSKACVTLTPMVDEIARHAKAFRNNDTDRALGQQFVNPLRIRIEALLWDLLGADLVVLTDPGLHSLIGKVQEFRKRKQPPFDEEPFRALIECQHLKDTATFREIINKAHHRDADQITPAEAMVALNHYDSVLALIDACWLSYARFMRRLPVDKAIAATSAPPAAPNVVQFPKLKLPMIGRLAAHGSDQPLPDAESATDVVDLSERGDVSLFTIAANTLGLMALTGQTVIVSHTDAVENGDLAVVQTPGRIFARRIGIDPKDGQRVALEAIQSASKNPSPTDFVLRAEARLNKIIGVLFDNSAPGAANGEAVATSASPIMTSITGLAEVVGDSAFPVAKDGDHVFLGKPDSPSALEGRIVAIVTSSDTSSTRTAYLKRLGKSMPGNPSVHYLENVGQIGEGEYVQFIAPGAKAIPGIPVVEQFWRVHGILYR